MVSFCMATASTASMEATEPWMPSPAENQVLNGSSAPTMTLEPDERIMKPIMVLKVPLMHSLTDFLCKISPKSATRPRMTAALMRILSMIKFRTAMVTSFS